jgi:hypothetical protein
MAPAVLGFSGAPFHEPFHARRRALSHGRTGAQRPDCRSAMPTNVAGHCPYQDSPGQGGHRAGRSAQPGISPRTPAASAAVPRRPPPGSRHRLAPGICDCQRQLPARDARRRHHAGRQKPHRPPGPARGRAPLPVTRAQYLRPGASRSPGYQPRQTVTNYL